MSLEIAVEADNSASLRVRLEARLHAVFEQIEFRRPLGIVISVLAREESVDVVAAAAEIGLFEDGLGEAHLRDVTRVATGLIEELPPPLDAYGRGGIGRRHEAESSRARQLGGYGLRRVLHRDCCDISDGELTRNPVAIGIRASLVPEAPDEFFSLHPQAERAHRGREIADRCHLSLRAERAHDEIREDTTNL